MMHILGRQSALSPQDPFLSNRPSQTEKVRRMPTRQSLAVYVLGLTHLFYLLANVSGLAQKRGPERRLGKRALPRALYCVRRI